MIRFLQVLDFRLMPPLQLLHALVVFLFNLFVLSLGSLFDLPELAGDVFVVGLNLCDVPLLDFAFSLGGCL